MAPSIPFPLDNSNSLPRSRQYLWLTQKTPAYTFLGSHRLPSNTRELDINHHLSTLLIHQHLPLERSIFPFIIPKTNFHCSMADAVIRRTSLNAYFNPRKPDDDGSLLKVVDWYPAHTQCTRRYPAKGHR